jgi:hypothetical protein
VSVGTRLVFYTPVWIEDEGDIFHLALVEFLLEWNTEILEPLACLFDIFDGDGDVTESLTGFGVSVGVPLEVGIGLGAVVVGELEDGCMERGDEIL